MGGVTRHGPGAVSVCVCPAQQLQSPYAYFFSSCHLPVSHLGVVFCRLDLPARYNFCVSHLHIIAPWVPLPSPACNRFCCPKQTARPNTAVPHRPRTHPLHALGPATSSSSPAGCARVFDAARKVLLHVNGPLVGDRAIVYRWCYLWLLWRGFKYDIAPSYNLVQLL